MLITKDHPVVAADHNGLIVFINEMFTKNYGWSKKDLIGQPIVNIMPPIFRNMHYIGFSRFLTTEKPTLLGKQLPLAVLFKNGTIKNAQHFILADKKDGLWRFAAIIDLK